MEVCGGHTAAIHRFALRDVLPSDIELLSGPGCPVCVTTASYLDRCLTMAQRPGTVIATFGDLLRVPGSTGSLADARARGADVRVVYSPIEALEYAKREPKQTVIFVAIGFETTACTIASMMEQAAHEQVSNFKILSALKTMPAALRALLNDPEVKIDGLILPGHVMTVTGVGPFEFIAREFAVPCAVSGFEAADLLQTILFLSQQVSEHRAGIEIQYARSVRYSGNETAQSAIAHVFEPSDEDWRGLGRIPGSGLKLREEYAAWDASPLAAAIPSGHADHGCRCGDVLRGVLHPEGCPLFGKACTPEQPRGACMVSSEGACAAAYHYATVDDE